MRACMHKSWTHSQCLRISDPEWILCENSTLLDCVATMVLPRIQDVFAAWCADMFCSSSKNFKTFASTKICRLNFQIFSWLFSLTLLSRFDSYVESVGARKAAASEAAREFSSFYIKLWHKPITGSARLGKKRSVRLFSRFVFGVAGSMCCKKRHVLEHV